MRKTNNQAPHTVLLTKTKKMHKPPPPKTKLQTQLHGLVLRNLRRHNITPANQKQLNQAVDDIVTSISNKLPAGTMLINQVQAHTPEQILEHIENLVLVKTETTRFQKLMKWVKEKVK